MEEVERRLLAVLDLVRGWLPSHQIASMTELALAGESGVGLENLCTQLYEYSVSVPEPVLEEIEYLARAMRLNPRYTRLLREVPPLSDS